MRVIEGLVMPGGWHFEQELDSGQHQRIEGRTYHELAERILLFRLQHIELVPSGTSTKERVMSDLLMWICSRFPGNCTGSRGELPQPTVPAKPAYARPTNRIEDWIKTLSDHDLEWIDQANATRRARICMGCQFNQRWETGCGPCNTNIRSRSLLIRGSHKTGFESQLRSCLSYGFLLEVAVWLKNTYADARRKPPPECWKRKEEEAVIATAPA